MTIQANFPAIKPSLMLDFANTKQLDSRITYTRASTASYYDGVTTSKAEENLLTYSEQFDNAIWTKTNTAVTANTTTAPDGTTTADSFNENTDVNQFHQIAQTFNIVGTLPNTWSVYLKANTRSNATLLLTSGGAFVFFAFDLSAGTVGAVQTSGSGWSSSTATITSVGNSWYRCTITSTYTTTGSCLAYIEINNGATRQYNGNGSGIYVWGAQCEQRSAVTAYTATTTQAITNYIPKLQSAASGIARFDNNPTTGESLGLLIEESRSNLITYSSDFTTAWTTSNATVTANTVVAPDGTLSGDKLFEDTATSGHSIAVNVTVTSGVSYTQSIYAKAGERPRLVMYEYSSTGAAATFDLTTGTVVATSGGGSPSATITSVGNGWYRCTMTWTTGSTNAGLSFRLQTAGATGATTYTGNGYSGLFIWGAQMELGAFATSYIPTVASQVTRAADAASMTGTNFSTWYNTAEGTFYGNAVPISLTGTYKILSTFPVAAGSFLTMSSNGGASVTGWYASGLGSLGTTLAENKLVAKYNTAKYFGGVMNGGTVVESTSSDFAGLATSLVIGQGSASYMNGTIKKIAYYPIRLTNAQIQALTS